MCVCEGGAGKIVNLSLDECTAHDVVHGWRPDKHYMEERLKSGRRPPYPAVATTDAGAGAGASPRAGGVGGTGAGAAAAAAVSGRTSVRPGEMMCTPMTALKPIRKSSKSESLMCCLSLANVDMRQHLELAKPELIIDSLRKSKFEEDYHRIVETVIDQLKPNLFILVKKKFFFQFFYFFFCTRFVLFFFFKVFPYEFHECLRDDMLLFSREDLVEVYGFVFLMVAKCAAKHGLPLIDLSRTLNPFERSHYGATAFDPSMHGAALMARLIEHVVVDLTGLPSTSLTTRRSASSVAASSGVGSSCKIYYGHTIQIFFFH